MARGIKQTNLDQRPLYRRNLQVHPSARAAYRYYRRFQMPSPQRSQDTQSTALPFPPIIVAQQASGRFWLVCDFPVLHLLGNTKKTTCCIRPAEDLNRKQIERLAWRSVMAYERIQECRPKVLAAKFLYLQALFPEDLIPEFFPADPKSGQSPRLKLSDFARACDVSTSTLNNFLPQIRAGGVADVNLGDVFANDQGASNE